MLKFEHPKQQSNIIKVIGVGGGGSNAVTHMFNQGIKGVDFILCNTDSQALDISPVPNKVHLGNRNLGAGNVPSVGRDAAIETRDALRDILEPHTKMLFITAGMGGGTGTGAAPVVAEMARELDILTVGIVTLPFNFEGRRRRQQALEGIDELRKYVDALLIISNDKLRDEYGNMKLTEAFKKADDVLAIAAKGIAEIITVTGYINVDFEDVKTVMKQSGKAIMGSGTAEGENRATKAIEDAMRSPLLNDSNISGAKNILLYITSGNEEVTFDEVKDITDYIHTICGNSAEVIWGNGTDPGLEDHIAITVIATGFAAEDDGKVINDLYADRRSASNVTRPTTVHTIGDIPNVTVEKEEAVVRQRPVEINQNDLAVKPVKIHALFEPEKQEEIVHEFEAEPEHETVESFAEVEDVDIEVYDASREVIFEIEQPVESHYEPPVMRFVDEKNDRIEMDRKSLERQSRLKAMSMKLKTHEGIEELESEPAFKRRGMQLNDEESTNDVSRYSVNPNDQRPGLRSDNSYLHDNVD
ncbi:MAG: cell division protein FtsZ [Bacteroidales bacterium]|nr:cell division protein FtsZ [Bacteroidales bacterium]